MVHFSLDTNPVQGASGSNISSSGAIILPFETNDVSKIEKMLVAFGGCCGWLLKRYFQGH
jgi:hypothetical protein